MTDWNALISDVVAGSPADEAGLHAGDVVVAYGGKAIADAAALQLIVYLRGQAQAINGSDQDPFRPPCDEPTECDGLAVGIIQ